MSKMLLHFRSEGIGVRSAEKLQLLTSHFSLLTSRLEGAA